MTHASDYSATWPEWPRCPQCGQRRHAVCPICQAARDELPLAEYLPPAAPLEETRVCCGSCGSAETSEAPEPSTEGEEIPVLLFCAKCDEAFAPEFRQLCQKCGHDFGDGIAEPEVPLAASGGRAMLAVCGLTALAAAILAYCWYLFQK